MYRFRSRSRKSVPGRTAPIIHRVPKLPKVSMLNPSDRAALHTVTLSSGDLFEFQKNNVSVLNKYAQPTWRRGDVITVANAVNYNIRNRAKAFWTGLEAVRPDNTQYDDYMAVPKQFEVIKEFHANYWTNVWDNTYRYCTPKFPKGLKSIIKRAMRDGDFSIQFLDDDLNTWTVINEMGIEPRLSSKDGLYQWGSTPYTLHTVESM